MLYLAQSTRITTLTTLKCVKMQRKLSVRTGSVLYAVAGIKMCPNTMSVFTRNQMQLHKFLSSCIMCKMYKSVEQCIMYNVQCVGPSQLHIRHTCRDKEHCGSLFQGFNQSSHEAGFDPSRKVNNYCRIILILTYIGLQGF
jgi:hypothetical protein